MPDQVGHDKGNQARPDKGNQVGLATVSGLTEASGQYDKKGLEEKFKSFLSLFGTRDVLHAADGASAPGINIILQ